MAHTKQQGEWPDGSSMIVRRSERKQMGSEKGDGPRGQQKDVGGCPGLIDYWKLINMDFFKKLLSSST